MLDNEFELGPVELNDPAYPTRKIYIPNPRVMTTDMIFIIFTFIPHIITHVYIVPI